MRVTDLSLAFRFVTVAVLTVLLMFAGAAVSLTHAQKLTGSRKVGASNKKAVPARDELTKLREEYIQATKQYRISLEKLLTIYEENAKRAEAKLAQSKQLFADGLIARSQVEESEHALAVEEGKVADVQRQMSTADTQIANVLVEAQADAQIARSLRLAKGGLTRTTAYIRYNGGAAWGLGDAWKVQQFFSDTFHRALPVAVFGQGAIHDRWRLDHRNSMDISLYPDSAEGQALLGFLQKNGIPYLAFRAAIPGTATGPHIHIGRPSHRY
jgi:hypothetical protein